MRRNTKKKTKLTEWLTPEERTAYDKIFADPHYRAEARVLRDGIVEWKKMLHKVFDKIAAAMEVFNQ